MPSDRTLCSTAALSTHAGLRVQGKGLAYSHPRPTRPHWGMTAGPREQAIIVYLSLAYPPFRKVEYRIFLWTATAQDSVLSLGIAASQPVPEQSRDATRHPVSFHLTAPDHSAPAGRSAS